MRIIKVKKKINYLYHYTKRENVTSILKDKKIKSLDEFVFFTDSLKKCVSLFEKEMMSDNLYIDVVGRLRQRVPASKQDYVIVKIPYYNDNCFYQFDFQNKESIYNISLAHKGNLAFEQAEILEFPTMKVHYNLVKALVMPSVLACLIWPHAASAMSLDTSWYNQSESVYSIRDTADFMGLSYLVNKQNVTFEDKVINIEDDIDITKCDWQTISDIFKGTLDGSHRIIMNSGTRLFENPNINFFDDKIIEIDSTHGIVNVNIQDNKVYYSVIANQGYKESQVKVTGVNGDILVENNSFTLSTGKIMIDVVYENEQYEILDKEKTYASDNLFYRATGLDLIKYIMINDEILDTQNYEISDGIILKKGYLETLQPGVYTLTVCYSNGAVAKTLVVIPNKEEVINPKTSDNIMMYISMLMISTVILIIYIIRNKKNMNKENMS